MPPDVTAISKPPKHFRAAPVESRRVRVDRDGGKYGAGIIRGASLVTRGEAIGHSSWLDTEFIRSVADAASGNDAGVKMRFTHPGLSSDGLGRFVARAFNGRFVEETGQAIADVHFAESGHKTPDGDLASYLMDLADEDDKAFAISIVFEPDREASQVFSDAHTEDDAFASPDEDNENNYRHARLAELLAADFVDDPAANPGGLFHRGHEIPSEADELLGYALGLTEEKPELTCFDADPDRAAAYVQRFLKSKGLKVMSSGTKEPGAADAVSKEQYDALSSKFDELFGKYESLSKQMSTLALTDNEDDELGAERERCRELYALASKVGVDDASELADKWVADGYSVVDAKASLADKLIEQNKLTSDPGQPEDDPHAKFRKEFRQGREQFAKFGITDEDAYVRTRCRDEGLPVPDAKKS